jgi:chloramphenicol-sensitive protein RarD
VSVVAQPEMHQIERWRGIDAATGGEDGTLHVDGIDGEEVDVSTTRPSTCRSQRRQEMVLQLRGVAIRRTTRGTTFVDLMDLHRTPRHLEFHERIEHRSRSRSPAEGQAAPPPAGDRCPDAAREQFGAVGGDCCWIEEDPSVHRRYRTGGDVPVKSELRSGVIAGMSAYLLWGFLTVYWKALKDFSAVELIGYRITSSVVLLVVLLAALHRLRPLLSALRDRRLLGRVSLAAVLLTANWTSYVWAVLHGNVIETALGYFMAPLGTMLIGVVVLKEKLRTRQKVAVGFAVAAVVVLTIGYGRVPWIALVLAATWSVYGLLKKQVPLQPYESLAAETLVLLVPAVALVVWGAGQAQGVPGTADAFHWVLILLSGVVTAVPLVLFAHAAQRVPFTILGPMQYVVPTINFLLGWLVYDEVLDLPRVVGFSLVWAALVIISIDTVGHTRKTAALAAAAAAVLSSCGAGVSEFRRQAETFIESRDMRDAQGHTYSRAECEEPVSTSVGTTFACTALDERRRDWSFTVVITEDQGILVVDGALAT